MRDKPIQIIQDITVNMSQEHYPYMPSSNALHSRIKRVKRAELPAQPQTIEEINVSDSLCLTLNSDTFLIRDCVIGNDRILLQSSLSIVTPLRTTKCCDYSEVCL